MTKSGGGTSTTAVIAVVVGGVLAWSGLRGWKVTVVVKDFLSGVDPATDPELQKPENQLPISVGGLATEMFSGLLGSIFGGGGSIIPGLPFKVPIPGLGIPIGNETSSKPQENFKYAQLLSGQFGWNNTSELDAWYQLGMKESGWRSTAQNPTSSAYGIGQFLDSTWKSYGPKTPDPYLQTLYMAKYIKDRYGTPSQALAFHKSHNWY